MWERQWKIGKKGGCWFILPKGRGGASMFCLICMVDKLKSLANEIRNISQKICCFRAGVKQRRQGTSVYCHFWSIECILAEQKKVLLTPNFWTVVEKNWWISFTVQPFNYSLWCVFIESCILPMEEGDCSRFTLRWYFNSQVGACRPFIYSGCGGNTNRYLQKEECEKHCVQQ